MTIGMPQVVLKRLRFYSVLASLEISFYRTYLYIDGFCSPVVPFDTTR